MATGNLSTAQAAELLDISANKVRDMITNGDFPNAFKEGRSWRIPQSDIDALSNGAPEAAPEPVSTAAATIEEIKEEIVEKASQAKEAVVEVVSEAVAETTEAVSEIRSGSTLQADQNRLTLYLFGSYVGVVVISVLSALFFG